MNYALETIAIGDEILSGKISDTNSTKIADSLLKQGIAVTRQTVISDRIVDIQQAVKEVSTRAMIAVCFGGLGPTSDDRTAEAVAGLLGSGLIEDNLSKQRLIDFYAKRASEVNSHALKQVLYPTGSEPIPNSLGLAPGFRVWFGQCLFFFLPGVPEEMTAMWGCGVLPFILNQMPDNYPRVLSCSLRCIGIHESELQKILDPIEAMLPAGSAIGYRTIFPENHVTLYFRKSIGESDEVFLQIKEKIRLRLSPWVYTESDEDLETVVGKILLSKKSRIAIAESCTGGLALHRLTRVPGASEYVWGGCTVYQPAAKSRLLGFKIVREDLAVSEQCTLELAKGMKKLSGCDISAAVTGYMGPTGGTPDNPIGTFFVCVLGQKTLLRRFTQTGKSRKQVQWSASTNLLNLVRQYLNENV